MSDALNWQGQFGYWPWTGNLDALTDGFREQPFGSEGRGALMLDGFHVLEQTDKDYAHIVLDIIEFSLARPSFARDDTHRIGTDR